MKLYRLLRDTHLLLGLFSFFFVLVYGVSSVKLSHPTWFAGKPSVEKLTSPITEAGGEGPRTVARELMEQHGMRGELRIIRETAAGFRLRISRAEHNYDVDYNRETGEAAVKATTRAPGTTMVALHIAAGLWPEWSGWNVWGAMAGFISLGLILLGLTGIYLWFKIHKERKIGLVLLALNLGYSLTLMVLMRMA